MKRLWYGFRFFLGWLLAALGSWSILRACQVVPSEEERETLRKALGKFGKLSDYSDQDIASHYWRSVRKNESDDYNKERYAGKRPKFLSHYTNEEISQEYLKRTKQRIDDNIEYTALREAEIREWRPETVGSEPKEWRTQEEIDLGFSNTSPYGPVEPVKSTYDVICPRCKRLHLLSYTGERTIVTCSCLAELFIEADGRLDFTAYETRHDLTKEDAPPEGTTFIAPDYNS